MTYSNTKPNQLKYLSSYTLEVQNKIRTMVEQDTLGRFLLKKHPKTHSINNDKMLREYVMNLKNTHLRKSSPLSKVIYDKKIHVVNNALGLHTFISRVSILLRTRTRIRLVVQNNRSCLCSRRPRCPLVGGSLADVFFAVVAI